MTVQEMTNMLDALNPVEMPMAEALQLSLIHISEPTRPY